MTEKYQIGIDLGGTNIAAGIVDENFRIVGKASVPTEVNGKNGVASPEEIADRMAQAVRLAAEKAAVSMDEVGSVGIGTPFSGNREVCQQPPLFPNSFEQDDGRSPA